MNGPPTAALPSIGEARNTLVAVVRQGHERTGRELIEDRSDPRHA
jgi:hypothetical protein